MLLLHKKNNGFVHIKISILGMKQRNNLTQRKSPSRTKLKEKNMLLSFFYSNGILQSIEVGKAKELEIKRKQKIEITKIKKSKARQRIRVKKLRAFSSQLELMLKQQISHVGHKRCIPEDDFFSFMSKAINSVKEMIEKFDSVKSLRNVSKEKLFLHKIPLHSLPKSLQAEFDNFCREMIEEEEISLEFINFRLKSVSKLYSMAFSCNLSSCCQSFCFFVH